ncbi:hypothetical protein ACFCYC_15465 [Streptomyces sp. NPDC056402]|uniref:hypothetical protein n=1 Tax=Streptomyces sp. NPDC056402 TaxID=3345810 RepID=UPI0035E34B41
MPGIRPRLLVLFAAAGAVVTAAGIWVSDDTRNPAAAGPPAAAPHVGTPADPATWTLPLSRYRADEAERKTVARAEFSLLQRCAQRFDITIEPDPELPPVGGRNVMDWRYGIHDPAQIAEQGYKPDPVQRARYEEVLRETARKPLPTPDERVVLMGSAVPDDVRGRASEEARSGHRHGRQIPEGGCLGEARRALGTSTDGTPRLADRLFNASSPAAEQGPDVTAAFTRWSQCMADAGFVYAKPMDANDDPKFGLGSSGAATPVEIATARADLTCRIRHRVAQTWHAAETRIQEQNIRDNQAELDGERAAWQETLARAGEELRTGTTWPPPPAQSAASRTTRKAQSHGR